MMPDGLAAAIPTPVAVLTGFLGAGKTTLLNALLRHPALGATAVIVNEFGAVGIDHHLIERIEGDLLVLTGGCLCCAARGDFTEALRGLLRQRALGERAFDRILVETTGLADPGPILNAPLLDPELWPLCRLGPLVTLVDVRDATAVLDRSVDATRQVAMADRIVLTKTDLLGPGDRPIPEGLETRVRDLNPRAPILDVREARADPAALLAPDASSSVPRLADRPRAGRAVIEAGAARHAAIDSDVLRAGVIDAGPLEAFLAVLRERHGPFILRLKGFAALTDEPGRPRVIQMVRHMLHPVSCLAAWPDADRGTRLVVITEGLRPGSVRDLWLDFFGPPMIGRPDAAALSAGDRGRQGLFG